MQQFTYMGIIDTLHLKNFYTFLQSLNGGFIFMEDYQQESKIIKFQSVSNPLKIPENLTNKDVQRGIDIEIIVVANK